MHLIEAALAWMAIDDDPIWRGLADEIAALCLDHMIDVRSGALYELFAADWTPFVDDGGGIVEPGHHYEWAYLLDRWARLTGRARPAAFGKSIAFADRSGIDRARGVAVNGVRLDGSVADAVAGFGRRPSGRAAMSLMPAAATIRGSTRRSRPCEGISTRPYPVCGTKTASPMEPLSSMRCRRPVFIISSAPSRNSGRRSGRSRRRLSTKKNRRWKTTVLVALLLRLLVQWIASERAGRSIIPLAFWIFLIGGGVLLLI